jgi:hypothetical protein
VSAAIVPVLHNHSTTLLQGRSLQSAVCLRAVGFMANVLLVKMQLNELLSIFDLASCVAEPPGTIKDSRFQAFLSDPAHMKS